MEKAMGIDELPDVEKAILEKMIRYQHKLLAYMPDEVMAVIHKAALYDGFLKKSEIPTPEEVERMQKFMNSPLDCRTLN